MKTFAIITAATLLLATALPAFADHNRFGRQSLLDINVGGNRGQVASVDANVKGVADVDIDLGGNRSDRGGRGHQRDYNTGCNTGCNDNNDHGGWQQQRGGGSLVDVDVNSGRRGGNGALVDLDVNTNQRGRNALVDLDVLSSKRGGGLLDLNIGGQSRGGNYGRRSTGGCNNGCDFGGGVGN